MKLNFADHSANERTFLAWIRTSIAIMAFGFVVGKFTVFLNYLSLSLNQPPVNDAPGAALLGLALLVLGSVVIATATVRFVLLEREIDRPDRKPPSVVLNVVLAFMLILTGVLLAGNLARYLFA